MDGTIHALTEAERSSVVRHLYQEHMLDVYRYVHRRCGDKTLAEDVTHDVFMRLVDLDGLAEVTIAWLKTAARNRMIDLLRRRGSFDEKIVELGGRRPQRGGLDAAEQVVLNEALAQLHPNHRMVLMLRYVDGYSTAELASLLGRSVKGVEALTRRAKAALRAQLEVTDE